MTHEHLVDGAKASPVVAFFAAWLGGMTINNWAALAALVYSLLLIVDKLRQMGVFAAIGRRFRSPRR
jgi:hypothetical protein